MTRRYLYRSDKPKYCYHVCTDIGAVCKLERSTCFAKIDTYADTPPRGRRMCSICAQLLGIQVPEIIAPPPRSASQSKSVALCSKPDPLLAYFGVTVHKHSTEGRRAAIRICQQEHEKVFGIRLPVLTWEMARSLLGTLKKDGRLPIPKGFVGPKVAFPKRPVSKKEKRKRSFVDRFISRSAKPQLTPEQIAFIVSDAFLESFEWRQLRYATIRRYGSRCMACGRSPKDGIVINVDHIKPRRRFPELALDPDNLQVLCADDNHGKGNWDQTDWR